MRLFRRRAAELDWGTAVQLVEDVLGDLDLGSEVHREQEGSAGAWQLSWGPSEVSMLLRPPDGRSAGSLQIRARLMSLPEGSALPLYRRLLDLNASELIESAFGLDHDMVVLTAECFWSELEDTRVARLVASICETIERHVDELAGEFSCLKVREVPS